MASAITTGSIQASGPSQEFVVRVPKNVKKRYNVMRFHNALNIDVAKWNQVKMERENNLKDFKAEEDAPKFGAGSEFGREQREEARRKKYGVILKKYNPEDQPWVLKTGGKTGKKYRGIREGGIAENASYYVFVKAADGVFEAFQVDEWYNFTPVQRYKTLNAEEAEEEFVKRDHVRNYFSIMWRKRMNREEEVDKDEEGEKKVKKKSSKYGRASGDLKISDMDDWLPSSEGDSEEEGVAEATDKAQPKKGGKKTAAKKKKKKKDGSDDEGIEDSDDGDDEGREVDYISDESSSSDDDVNEKPNKDLKGVEDEEAIRKMEDSESEEENPEKKENPDEANKDETTPGKPTKEKKDSKKTASSSESSSDTSDSDDFDNDTSFQSALFVPKSKRSKDSGSSRNSRADNPARGGDGHKRESKAQKRKAATQSNADDNLPVPTKKAKGQSSVQMMQSAGASSTSASAALTRPTVAELLSEGITEDTVRRYLMRKPMTTTELLHKFKSKKTGITREQLVNTLAQILKRLDPEKHTVKGKMYLSIKQT